MPSCRFTPTSLLFPITWNPPASPEMLNTLWEKVLSTLFLIHKLTNAQYWLESPDFKFLLYNPVQVLRWVMTIPAIKGHQSIIRQTTIDIHTHYTPRVNIRVIMWHWEKARAPWENPQPRVFLKCDLITPGVHAPLPPHPTDTFKALSL